jgi:hypothetical protein
MHYSMYLLQIKLYDHVKLIFIFHKLNYIYSLQNIRQDHLNSRYKYQVVVLLAKNNISFLGELMVFLYIVCNKNILKYYNITIVYRRVQH